MDMNQQNTYITAPDDSSRIVREAIPAPGQPVVVIPSMTGDRQGFLPNGGSLGAHRPKPNAMSLAWRGLRVLGLAFGIAALWFMVAWVRHGRIPLGIILSKQPVIGISVRSPSPILPPAWIVAILGFMVLISLMMMLVGTHQAMPKTKSMRQE